MRFGVYASRDDYELYDQVNGLNQSAHVAFFQM